MYNRWMIYGWYSLIYGLFTLFHIFPGNNGNIANISSIANYYQRNETIEDGVLEVIISSTTIEIKVKNPNYTIIDLKCKETIPKNSVPKSSNHFICDNLKPCTDYLIQTKLLDTNLNQTVKKFIVRTDYAKPGADIDMIIPNRHSIFISWNRTNCGCISQFVIDTSYKDVVIKSDALNNSQNSLDIDELQSCGKYKIIFQVLDINNSSAKTSTTELETSFSDPGIVEDINTSINSDFSIKITWTPLESELCIKYYYLKWTKLDCLIKSKDSYTLKDKCTWTYLNYTNSNDHEIREVNLTNLDGCTDYALFIRPNGDHLENPFYFTITTLPQKPGTIREFYINKINSTTVIITWKPPLNHSECIKHYEIKICSFTEDYCKNFTTEKNDRTRKFIGLEPCADYNVTISAIDNSGQENEPIAKNFTMDEDGPSPVENSSIQIYPTEMLIKWLPPVFARFCIINYKVKGWSTQDPDNKNYKFERYPKSNETKAIIHDLVSCMHYTVEILSIMKKDQKEGEKIQLKVETTPRPSDPPKDPSMKSAMSHSLELSTRDNDQKNQCPVLVAQFTCETDDDVEFKYAEQTVPGYLSEFTAILEPLSPYITYLCKVRLFNIAGGWSGYSLGRFKTEKYYPEVPENVTVTATSNTSINIKWNQPKFINGQYILYKLYIQTIGPRYRIPSNCANFKLQNFSIPVDSLVEYAFKDAQPYIEYSIQIAGKNDYGTGQYSTPVRVITDPWIPEPVENFKVQEINGPEVTSEYKASVVLFWELPCQSNGEIIGFEGIFIGVRPDYPEHEFSWLMKIDDPFEMGGTTFTWHEKRLKPEYDYLVTISVIVRGLKDKSENKRLKFISPAGIPPRMNLTNQSSINTFASKNPTSSALLSFSVDILKTDMGGICFIAILVSEKGCQCDPPLKFDKIDSYQEWPDILSWYDVQEEDCISQYQTTPIRWHPTRSRRYERHVNNAEHSYEYEIGTDDCSNRKSSFCNGPLKPNKKYIAVMRLFTKSGYSDAAVLEFQTDSVVELYFILLLIVSCLLFAFMLGFIYLWFTKRIKWHRHSTYGFDETGEISAKNFLLHYDDLTKRDKLMREFKELLVVANDLSLSNSASKSNENKNRYTNIFPYDKNRVILGCDADGGDYINASFINGYKNKKEYIATQGPKPESLIDFWKMILQYNVRVIVMLTQFKEGDIVKCYQYFPQLSKEMKIGNNIEVRCTKENLQELYDRRELVVEHTGDGILQKVVHYYFKKWPDHDCPRDPNDLITFVRKVKSEKIPSQSAIVIHCSAGVGRTGTFIGLDIMMQKLKSEGKINIFETVKELRFQRMKMVQTIQQYQFLYECMYQLVQKKFPKKKSDKIIENNTNSNEIHLNSRSSDTTTEMNTSTSKRLSFSPNDVESGL